MPASARAALPEAALSWAKLGAEGARLQPGMPVSKAIVARSLGMQSAPSGSGAGGLAQSLAQRVTVQPSAVLEAARRASTGPSAAGMLGVQDLETLEAMLAATEGASGKTTSGGQKDGSASQAAFKGAGGAAGAGRGAVGAAGVVRRGGRARQPSAKVKEQLLEGDGDSDGGIGGDVAEQRGVARGSAGPSSAAAAGASSAVLGHAAQHSASGISASGKRPVVSIPDYPLNPERVGLQDVRGVTARWRRCSRTAIGSGAFLLGAELGQARMQGDVDAVMAAGTTRGPAQEQVHVKTGMTATEQSLADRRRAAEEAGVDLGGASGPDGHEGALGIGGGLEDAVAGAMLGKRSTLTSRPVSLLSIVRRFQLLGGAQGKQRKQAPAAAQTRSGGSPGSPGRGEGGSRPRPRRDTRRGAATAAAASDSSEGASLAPHSPRGRAPSVAGTEDGTAQGSASPPDSSGAAGARSSKRRGPENARLWDEAVETGGRSPSQQPPASERILAARRRRAQSFALPLSPALATQAGGQGRTYHAQLR